MAPVRHAIPATAGGGAVAGRPTHPAPARALGRGSKRAFLPTTKWEALVSFILGGVALFVLAAPLTGGRVGVVSVVGDSMQSVIPWGSCVVVFPLGVKEGQYAVAYGSLCDPETKEDSLPTLMVKKMEGGRLVSTDSGVHPREYAVRGRVVAVIPLHRLLPWRDRGGQRVVAQSRVPDAVKERYAVSQAARDKDRARALYWERDGRRIAGEGLPSKRFQSPGGDLSKLSDGRMGLTPVDISRAWTCRSPAALVIDTRGVTRLAVKPLDSIMIPRAWTCDAPIRDEYGWWVVQVGGRETVTFRTASVPQGTLCGIDEVVSLPR